MECLKRIHIVQSKNLTEFCINIRSIKHILNTNKSIRLVIIDEMNTFFINKEHTKYRKSEDTRKNRRSSHSFKILDVQQISFIKDYLAEIYNYYYRCCFI